MPHSSERPVDEGHRVHVPAADRDSVRRRRQGFSKPGLEGIHTWSHPITNEINRDRVNADCRGTGCTTGDRVALLLGGYDKGRYPKKKRQQREITQARKLLRQLKRRRRLIR